MESIHKDEGKRFEQLPNKVSMFWLIKHQWRAHTHTGYICRVSMCMTLYENEFSCKHTMCNAIPQIYYNRKIKVLVMH